MATAMNPQFHKNILNIYSQTRSGVGGLEDNATSNSNGTGWGPLNLYRGTIINKEATKGVRFLYNPSQIQVTHPLDPSQPLPPGVSGGDTATLNPATNAGSLGLDLLFDRTYEVWGSATNPGVLVDVRAFYALTGILLDADATSKPETILPMTPVPAYFYIGQSGVGLKERATTRPLSYFGWITTLVVTYTHWSMNMIPMRCAINVSVNLMPNADDTSAGAPGAGSVTGTTPAAGQSLLQLGADPAPAAGGGQTPLPSPGVPGGPPVVHPFPRPF